METVKYSGKRNLTVVTGRLTPMGVETDDRLEEYRERYRNVAIIIDGEKIVGALAMPEGESLWAFSKSREFAEAMGRYA